MAFINILCCNIRKTLADKVNSSNQQNFCNYLINSVSSSKFRHLACLRGIICIIGIKPLSPGHIPLSIVLFWS